MRSLSKHPNTGRDQKLAKGFKQQIKHAFQCFEPLPSAGVITGWRKGERRQNYYLSQPFQEANLLPSVTTRDPSQLDNAPDVNIYDLSPLPADQITAGVSVCSHLGKQSMLFQRLLQRSRLFVLSEQADTPAMPFVIRRGSRRKPSCATKS